MDWQRKCLRAGTWAVLLAIAVRLVSSGFPERLLQWLRQPETAAVLMYLETGKVFRPPPADVPETAPPTEPPETAEPVPVLPIFSQEDEELVTVRDTSGNTADIGALLEMPLNWNLTTAAPGVLIYHTHATESYTQTAADTYDESSDFRTLDTDRNMVSIGRHLEELLTRAGIGVIRSETLHDYPSYDGGYDSSRETVREALAEHGGIRLVLDLHRDAAVDANGRQFATSATVNGRESAQILFLIGTGHPNWQENLALAAKLTVLLERTHPGITRGILTRTYDYNQDLSGGALLVEIGAAGDTREKALVAAEALAEAIVLLANGTE